MKAIFTFVVPVLAGVSFFALTGCGAEGGCGAPPPSTAPQVTCGTGTHQSGNTCVRNAPRTNSGGNNNNTTSQPVNDPAPPQ